MSLIESIRLARLLLPINHPVRLAQLLLSQLPPFGEFSRAAAVINRRLSPSPCTTINTQIIGEGKTSEVIAFPGLKNSTETTAGSLLSWPSST